VEELFIEVDENNNKIGLRPIEDFQTGKFIHRSSHLLLFNSKNEVLICKRSSNKKWYPNFYTYSVSGTVKDQSYEDCVKEEMKEELRVDIPVKLLFIYPYFDERDKSFHVLFLGKTNKKINPDKREISSLRWLTLEELREDILRNPQNYVPHVVFGLKKYFDEFVSN
jgi:isopentenyldiphosphate isomerase